MVGGISRASTASPVNGGAPRRNTTRSRASSINDRFGRIEEDEPLEPPRRIGSRVPSAASSPRKELPGFDLPVRPNQNTRSTSTPGFEGPTSLNRGESPAGMPRLSRVPTEPSQLLGARSNLRITKLRGQDGAPDVFGDDHSDYGSSTFDEHHRTPSWSTMSQDGGSQTKKAPPPPPPSRAKKPPPPPPMKRSALSSSEVPQY